MILNLLVEGSFIRSIISTSGASINTVGKLLINAGLAYAEYHHNSVRNVKFKRIQCDEIWSFYYTKQTNRLDSISASEVLSMSARGRPLTLMQN